MCFSEVLRDEYCCFVNENGLQSKGDVMFFEHNKGEIAMMLLIDKDFKRYFVAEGLNNGG